MEEDDQRNPTRKGGRSQARWPKRDAAERVRLYARAHYVPFAVVMRDKKHPKKAWDALFERYASDTTFNKATVQTSLARLKYSGQKMDEYVAEFEGLSAKLESMGASMDEGIQDSIIFKVLAVRTASRAHFLRVGTV